MKNKNYFVRLTLKNIHFFILFGIITYIMSDIVVRGSNLISTSMDSVTNGIRIDVEKLILCMFGYIAVCMCLGFIKKICEEMFSIRIQKACKNMAVETLPTIEMRFFNNNAGTIINKLISDINDVTEFYSNVVPEIFQIGISIITYCVAIGKINLNLLFGVLICFPLVLFISNKIARKTIALAKKRKSKFDTLVKIQEDSLAGISVVRTYDLFNTLSDKVGKIINGILKNEFTRNRYMAISEAAQLLVRWIPSVVCSFIALHEVFSGRVSVGTMMAFLILFYKIAEPLSQLPFKINDGREMIVSLRRINSIINAPKELNSGIYCGDVNKNEKNIIELKDISFGYNDENIIENLNLCIERGKTTAIVGASGAGKTTLIKILCGFERANAGQYLLGGIDFKDWELKQARNQISLISQNVFLFPDTIAANIAYGKENATLSEIENVCKKVGIHDYIMSLSGKYDTMLGERGVNFSGGERQRLSIARAFLKDAPIIIMDEPTSALDVNSENVIKESIGRYWGNKTIIIIAHRLSTIEDVDRIVVMSIGKIVESGTHDELMDMDGIYTELYSKEK